MLMIMGAEIGIFVFDKMGPGEFSAKASAYAGNHPYAEKAQIL